MPGALSNFDRAKIYILTLTLNNGIIRNLRARTLPTQNTTGTAGSIFTSKTHGTNYSQKIFK